MKKYVFAMLFSLVSLSTLAAQSKQVPEVLVNGFNSYKEVGPKSAIEAWIKGSGIDGSKEALAQANMLSQIGEFYGKYLGYEVVKINQIASKSNVYLIVVNYEKGSLFASFYTYMLPAGKEVIQTFNFNTDPQKIWPTSIIYGQ